MSKSDNLLEYLKKYGHITALEIAQKFNTTCPHSLIRDVRNKIGFNKITSVFCTNKNTKSRYKKYFYWEQ